VKSRAAWVERHNRIGHTRSARSLQLVRMTAGVVAARADLDLNDVEDLRLAVDELCLP